MINQLAGCSDRYGGGHLRHTSLSGADRTSATAGKSRAFCAASRTSGENRSLIGPPKEPCPARNRPQTLSSGGAFFASDQAKTRRGEALPVTTHISQARARSGASHTYARACQRGWRLSQQDANAMDRWLGPRSAIPSAGTRSSAALWFRASSRTEARSGLSCPTRLRGEVRRSRADASRFLSPLPGGGGCRVRRPIQEPRRSFWRWLPRRNESRRLSNVRPSRVPRPRHAASAGGR